MLPLRSTRQKRFKILSIVQIKDVLSHIRNIQIQNLKRSLNCEIY